MVSSPMVVTTPTGQSPQPRVVARFDGPLPAPVVKGTKVGTVVVTLADGKVIEEPIETAADVPRLGPVSRVASLLKHYLFGWLS
jgi:D-alanyl-D-alanine carboxypeptidase (penicillin-binding protein 5/6)